MWSKLIMKYSKHINTGIAFCILGIVDQVHGDIVAVELSFTSEQSSISPNADLPLWMFPCEISEGSKFYFTKTNETFELRCGMPQE